MAKHGLKKSNFFNTIGRIGDMVSSAKGTYTCKCGMVFDSTDKFNEHLRLTNKE